MSEFALPICYALFIWWFSTGVILYLDGLPRRTFGTSMAVGTVVAVAAIVGLAMTRGDTTASGAYIAFTCALLVWGWQEMAFLMGFVTGTRKSPSPPGCSGWRHFVNATEAIAHHELALVASLGAVVAVTWEGANQVGTWTFLTLWVMRQSTKLNLFLGVRNTNEHFLPEHLAYLKSFLTRRPMNLLFPVSVTASTVVATLMINVAIAPETHAFERSGVTLVAAMLVLGILEHWFLVLPFPFEALWNWAMRSRASERR